MLKEGLLKRLKNIEDKNKEQLKAIEDQKEVQTKLISRDKIKAPLLKSIYNEEVKNDRINNDEAQKIFRTLEDIESSKIDYSKLIYKSSDNQYFDFNRFRPLSSVYLKLVNGGIGINVLKWRLKEFKDDIDKLINKKTKKEPYRRNEKDVLENANALYDRVKIIIGAFERVVFDYGGHTKIDVNYDLETYGLSDKELQMFKKLFNYANPNELWNDLMYTD